jgi:hypothetical protein
MNEVRLCLSPRGPLDRFVPSPGTWSEAELDTLRRFAGLVRAGATPRARARDWRTCLAALEVVRTLDPCYAALCDRAEAQLREALVEIAAAGLAELTRR